MRDALRFFVRNQPVASGLFVAALAVAIFFAVKFLLHWGQFQGHAPRDQALEAWMRPRYVAMSYNVPPKVLREDILGMGPPSKESDREPVTMEEIAAQKGISLDELTEIVREGAEAFHAERGR